MQGYIKHIRGDGKIDCTLSLGGRDDLENAKAKILIALHAAEGLLPLHDKSPPEQVQKMLGLSKKLFKKGLGGLYKDGVVELVDGGIRLKN